MTVFGYLTMGNLLGALAFAVFLFAWTVVLWHSRFQYVLTSTYAIVFCVCAVSLVAGINNIVKSSRPLPALEKAAAERGEISMDEYWRNRRELEMRSLPRFESGLRQAKASMTILAFGWLVGGGLGMLIGYRAYRRGLIGPYIQKPKLADIQGFVDMLAAACENAGMQGTLEKLLSLPDGQRKELLAQIIQEMRERRAPKDIVDAFICLQDDAIAEKAYEAVYKCPRGVPIAPLQPLRTAA